MIAGSNLEKVLSSGQFAVTGELGPPKSGDYEVVREKARILRGHVDAVNITDCQTAIVRMSSLTAGLIALSEGVEPVMQMTCRDRNRIGIQADVLGASALGIRNLLCLTGDHQKFGNHPHSKGVFDMDSIQLLGMIKGMRDDKKFQCGEEIKSHEPRLFLGAAANPFADPFEFRPIRLAKKIQAGANFIQTQIIYNVEKFKKFMEIVRDLGLHEKAYILAGVTPPKSLGMARYMKNFVPGLDVTDDVISRLRDAKDQREEGINICVDIINQVREIPGVAGVHVMAIEWEQAVPDIVSRAGLSPRPAYEGVEPTLVSSASIEAAVEEAKTQAKKELEGELQQAKAEADASRKLVAKEKDRVAYEISGLKKQVEEAKSMVSQKEAEIQRLTQELAKTKAEIESQAGQPAVATQAQAVAPAADNIPVVGGALTGREERVLQSLNSGLEALRKVLGLSDEGYEALKRFLEAEFLLHMGTPVPVAQPAPPQPAPQPVAEPTPAVAPSEPKEVETAQEEPRNKELVNLIAKGNVLLHKNDFDGALKAFEEALAIDPDDEKAREGLNKAKEGLSQAAPAAATESTDLLPPCPEELTPEEWRQKWVIRYVAKGNVALQRGNAEQAVEYFKKALELDPQDEKAKAGLSKAEAGETGPVVTEEPAKPEVAPAEPEAKEEKKEVKPEVVEEPKKEEAPKAEEKKPEPKPEPAKPKAAPAAKAAVSGEIGVAALAKETMSLTERAGSISPDLFIEKASGAIKEVTIGDEDKAITVGGASALPFYWFEGDMGNRPQIAFEVLDSEPEDLPESLAKYYSDVLSDPIAWAKKCVSEYGAKSICLSLVSTDPNGQNKPSVDAAKMAQSVIEAIDVPVILWGCGNAEKDTETLREVTSLIGDKKVCLGPLTDANYRTVGATAMAFQLPVVASTPIDVNLAKQLNILLENLGVTLNHILMDPSIGAVGYGLEYTYSVMERIRLAALTQQDEKLQAPFIVNLGREVWKTKETRLPSDDLMGDQEIRGILMEAITASSLLMAGGELMVMRHPRAISLTEALIEAMS